MHRKQTVSIVSGDLGIVGVVITREDINNSRASMVSG
jgi:hypothetical protein